MAAAFGGLRAEPFLAELGNETAPVTFPLSGIWLDRAGLNFGVLRMIGESDQSLRQRVIAVIVA